MAPAVAALLSAVSAGTPMSQSSARSNAGAPSGGGVRSAVEGASGAAASGGSLSADAPPLNKAALRAALLDLVNDDAFLTQLHARYAKAAQSKK
jgi:hypothetical protein